MNRFITKILFLSAIFNIGLTSCLGDSSDVVTEQSLGQCLSYAKDVNSYAQIFSNILFSAEYNSTNYTVDLTVTGLVLPVAGNSTGLAVPKMKFTGLPWSYNAYGWKVVDVENVKPQIVGMTDVPDFGELKFMLLDNFSENGFVPGIVYEFEISLGETLAEVSGCCMTGKTVSVAPDGASYSPEDDPVIKDKNRPAYWVNFDFKDMKADIYLYNAKFLDRMPSLNLEFPDVPFTVSQGKVSLDCADLTPVYDGVPNKGFPISQLKGTVDFSEGMNLSFHCNFRGADYSVTFEGEY